MRNLVFKNLTCGTKKRKVLVSSEIAEREGVKSRIERHFICMVKEADKESLTKTPPELYVIKEHNTQGQRERFFCKLKGNICMIHNKKTYLVTYLHSLNIILTPATHPALP